MAKFTYLSPEQTYHLTPVKEDRWFQENQHLILRMANTHVGRDLLAIPQDYPLIVKMSKCGVHALEGFDQSGTRAELIADFRIGAKWANCIRSRWEQFNSMSRYASANLMAVPVPMSPLVRSARAEHVLTSTTYPDPDPETTTVDGVTYRDANQSWTNLRAGAGTVGNDTVDQEGFVYVGHYNGGQWQYCQRSIFLFDTSSLTASANISAATWSCVCFAKGATGNFGVALNVCGSSPASNTAIVAADYQQTQTTLFCDTKIAYASFTADGTTRNDFAFNAAGLAAISTTGVTKTSGKEANFDITGTDPAGSGSQTDYITCAYADKTGGTTNDPRLITTYTVPATSYKNLTLLHAG